MDTRRSSLAVTLSVWKALFLRETLTRLAKGRVAWLWLLLEPVAHVALMMLIFTAIRGRSMPSIDFGFFLAIGVLAWQMASGATLRPMNAIDANSALFAYRQVKPVDTVLVRALLEGLLQILVSAILLSGAAFIGVRVTVHDPLGVLGAATALWLFGTGLGLMFSVGSTLVPEIGKVVQIIFFPLHLLSGIFFAPSVVPPELRQWLILNPLMQAIDLLRRAFIPGYPITQGIEISYLAGSALITVFLGLALHVRFARRLIQQ